MMESVLTPFFCIAAAGAKVALAAVADLISVFTKATSRNWKNGRAPCDVLFTNAACKCKQRWGGRRSGESGDH